MNSPKDFAFKETSLFDWESEPAEERPSEFAASTLSPYAPLPPRRRKPPSRLLSVAFVASIAALGLGGALLVGLVHLLRA